MLGTALSNAQKPNGLQTRTAYLLRKKRTTKITQTLKGISPKQQQTLPAVKTQPKKPVNNSRPVQTPGAETCKTTESKHLASV
jgi:hypothetical protein